MASCRPVVRAGVGLACRGLWRQFEIAAGPGIEPRHAPTCYWREQSSALYLAAGKGGANGLNDNAAVLNDVNVLRLPLPEFLR